MPIATIQRLFQRIGGEAFESNGVESDSHATPPSAKTAPPVTKTKEATPAASNAPAKNGKSDAGNTPAAIDSVPEEEPGEPLRGVSARIVANMELSLSVPTATSIREVPAKLLEINRRVLNNHLKRVRGGKTSFTHFLGYAIVRAIASDVGAMNNAYFEGAGGKPRLIRNEHINMGLAVDQQKSDGSRTLIVPVIKNCETMNFREYVEAYNALIDKVRATK